MDEVVANGAIKEALGNIYIFIEELRKVVKNLHERTIVLEEYIKNQEAFKRMRN